VVLEVSEATNLLINSSTYIIYRDFYGINSLLSPTCLLTRCKEGKKKNIYFTSPAVRDIVINNHHIIKVNQHVLRSIYMASECFRILRESSELGSSVSIVSDYGLDYRVIEVRSPGEVKGFFL
jgi:hypothetical protein